MTQNIVKDALDNGLTLKQERYCKSLASGSQQVEAAREAGYKLDGKTSPSLPSRMIRQERIQARIHELIAQECYEDDAHRVWRSVLDASADLYDAGSARWQAIIDKQLKVLDQIARLGGWEPAKTHEHKQLVIKGSVQDVLPK